MHPSAIFASHLGTKTKKIDVSHLKFETDMQTLSDVLLTYLPLPVLFFVKQFFASSLMYVPGLDSLILSA